MIKIRVILIGFILCGIVFFPQSGFTFSISALTTFISIYIAWLIAALFSSKYMQQQSNSISYNIAPVFKSLLLILLFLCVQHYLSLISRAEYVQTIRASFTVFAIELLVSVMYFSFRKPINPHFDLKDNITGEAYLKIDLNKACLVHDVMSAYTPDVVKMDGYLTLIASGLKEKLTCRIASVADIQNKERREDACMSSDVLVDEQRVNCYTRINRHLLFCYEKITVGGTLVGSFVPLETFYDGMRKKYGRFYKSVYPFHFLWHRVLPKISYINRIYFICTKNHFRLLSAAEVYGRLSYCGFTLLKDFDVNGVRFFAAQKNMRISDIKHPSYGPFIKLRRVGLNGAPIFVRKIRSMYPYSEFLQKRVYDLKKLDNTGKFKDDFRLTGWGRFLRKYWLDELPQLLDWFSGKLKLVGVRPLSEHFFSLYPKEFQLVRITEKPGLIPPYYASMPNNFESIIECEREYIIQKKRRALLTDFIYFYKAMRNILFKGAHSK